jgi:hypothetical protein
MGPAHAASRFWALITVIADHGLPVGVGSLRSFKMRAISRADLPGPLREHRLQRLRALDCGLFQIATMIA